MTSEKIISDYPVQSEQDTNLGKVEIRYTRVANWDSKDFLEYNLGAPAVKLHKQATKQYQNDAVL